MSSDAQEINDWYHDQEALYGESDVDYSEDVCEECESTDCECEPWECPTCGRHSCEGYCPV